MPYKLPGTFRQASGKLPGILLVICLDIRSWLDVPATRLEQPNISLVLSLSLSLYIYNIYIHMYTIHEYIYIYIYIFISLSLSLSLYIYIYWASISPRHQPSVWRAGGWPWRSGGRADGENWAPTCPNLSLLLRNVTPHIILQASGNASWKLPEASGTQENWVLATSFRQGFRKPSGTFRNTGNSNFYLLKPTSTTQLVPNSFDTSYHLSWYGGLWRQSYIYIYIYIYI